MQFNFEWYDLKAFASNERYAALVKGFYDQAVKEAASLALTVKQDPNKPFSFDQYPALKERAEKIFKDLASKVTLNINNGTLQAWTIGNAKNDALLSHLFKSTGISKSVLSSQYQFGARNSEALKGFQNRKDNGLGLSQRVWNYTLQAKSEIESAIDIGLSEGNGAAKLTKSIRSLLNNPDTLFRRVRDKRGGLQLSKAAKAFHPGTGVYRSSYKNAMRLTRTETNMAYREADHQRWSKMPFVKGIEVKLSNRPDHCPLCEKLKGEYPKTFKFIGWHPQCRCFAIPILSSDDEFKKIIDGDLNGPEEPVTDVPYGFTDWLENNRSRIASTHKLPYYVRDNRRLVNDLLESLKSGTFDISQFMSGDAFTNSDIKKLMKEVSRLQPDWFRGGLDKMSFTNSKSYMMQHSMSYKSKTMEWLGGSTLSVSTNTFSTGFNPANELRGALTAIAKGEKLTFNQEYSVESLWHEILHARTVSPPTKLTRLQTEHMETVNQFVARNTYDEFLKLLGGKASHKADILENGYGYKTWVANFRKRLAELGIYEKAAVKFLQPHLFSNYSNLGLKISELFSTGNIVKP